MLIADNLQLAQAFGAPVSRRSGGQLATGRRWTLKYDLGRFSLKDMIKYA